MSNEDYILKKAKELRKVSKESLEEYLAKQERLVCRMNEIMLSRSDILELIGGEENTEMMRDNHNNHHRFVVSIIEFPDPNVLYDTVCWVFRAYMSRGFHTNYWAAQINTWIKLLKDELSEEAYRGLLPLYEWFTTSIPHFTESAESFIGEK